MSIEIIKEIAYWTMIAIVFKSLIIGSEFDFWSYFKDGKNYTNWYDNRQTYEQFKSKGE